MRTIFPHEKEYWSSNDKVSFVMREALRLTEIN